jgi:alpha-glucosidase
LLHAAFNFDFLAQHWGAGNFLNSILKWEKELGGRAWPNYVLSNHDQRRAATRYYRTSDDAPAKVAMGMLLTLRGTPFLYYGEEIGMRDIPIHRSEIQDPIGKYYWPFHKGRDGCRAPMQWSDAPNAGFSTGKPWLKVNLDYSLRNVQTQKEDGNSLFNFTRSLIALRKANPALMHGTFDLLTPEPKEALAYLRQTPEQKILVALNFTGHIAHIQIPEGRWQVILSTEQSVPPRGKGLVLKPYQVCILRST